MYTKFECLDGKQVDIKDCLKKCRMGKRCLSLRALRAVADQREWTGTPSTTQLLNGTRESYLKIKHDYCVKPTDAVFMLHGTSVHGVLEGYVKEDELSEVRLDDGISSGAFDFYTPEDGGTLYDTKTYGSYKTAKVLGLEKVETPTGNYYKNGKPKMRKYFTNTGRHDRLDLAIQLNDYRMKIESQLGKPVNKLMCEIIVRDGNTYMAEQRGVTLPAYLVEINKISDCWVRAYMKKKSDDLKKALENDELPPPCKPRERWGGRKCESYCPVSQYCEYGNKGVKNEKD